MIIAILKAFRKWSELEGAEWDCARKRACCKLTALPVLPQPRAFRMLSEVQFCMCTCATMASAPREAASRACCTLCTWIMSLMPACLTRFASDATSPNESHCASSQPLNLSFALTAVLHDCLSRPGLLLWPGMSQNRNFRMCHALHMVWCIATSRSYYDKMVIQAFADQDCLSTEWQKSHYRVWLQLNGCIQQLLVCERHETDANGSLATRGLLSLHKFPSKGATRLTRLLHVSYGLRAPAQT